MFTWGLFLKVVKLIEEKTVLSMDPENERVAQAALRALKHLVMRELSHLLTVCPGAVMPLLDIITNVLLKSISPFRHDLVQEEAASILEVH